MDLASSRTADQYSGAAGDAYHERLHALEPAAAELLAIDRGKKFRRYVNADDRVVEFGVGPGWNLWHLTCAERVGVDVATAYAAEFERRGVELVGSSSVLPDASADVVLCHHMLEHVTHPSDVLAEAHRVLRPDGRLLVYVPYENLRRYRRFDPGEPNMHLFAWNAQTLGALVSSSGFDVLTADVERFGYDRVSATTAVRLRQGARGQRVIRAILSGLRPRREVRVIARRRQ